MERKKNITVTGISSVIHVAKNNPPGKVDYYGQLYTHELIFRLCGEVSTEFDGDILVNETGTVQYLPKGSGGTLYRVTTVKTGECIDVFFDTDGPLYDRALCVRPEAEAQLGQLFRKIRDVWFLKEPNYYYRAMSILYQILFLLMREEGGREGQSSEKYPLIAPAVQYVSDHFCEKDLDVPGLASMCGISYSYFRRIFKECMGMSPANYVIGKKVEYAKELLSSGQYRVGEVAELLGFCDVYYFSRQFKKITGITPKDCRR